MISKKDKMKIIKLAKKYKISTIYLFGSSLDKYNKGNDIDLGVKGIPPKLFFKFYGELIRSLSKSVDLVDLSKKSSFNNVVEKNGVKIYG
jgi:predicted nucleotidyltransferase